MEGKGGGEVAGSQCLLSTHAAEEEENNHTPSDKVLCTATNVLIYLQPRMLIVNIVVELPAKTTDSENMHSSLNYHYPYGC